MSSQILDGVLQQIIQLGGEALFVTDPYNIFYLTGFLGKIPHARESSFLLSKEKALLFVPEMYRQEALSSSAVVSGHVTVVADPERDRLLSLFEQHLPIQTKVLVEGENLSYVEFKNLFEHSAHKIIPSEGLIRELRQIKSSEEIAKLRKAEEITVATLNETLRFLRLANFEELSELDLVDKIQRIALDIGAQGLGFETIVASGPGSASPHYKPTTKKVKKNEALLIDLGMLHQGYTGDLTRTVFLGKAPDKFKNAYAAVLEANTKSIAACKAGISAEALYHVSKDSLAAHGLDAHYIHGLGHAVGVEIHEEPKLRAGRKELLKPAMCITIEPGLYFQGEFGIRIEDLVVVQSDGCTVLSDLAAKELVEIG